MTTFNLMDPPFNATGNGVTDDFAAIRAWASACQANGGVGIVPVAPVGYRCSAPITGPGFTLRGEGYSAQNLPLGGANRASAFLPDPGVDLFKIDSERPFFGFDFEVRGGGTAISLDCADLSHSRNMQHPVLERVQIIGAATGVYTGSVTVFDFAKLRLYNCSARSIVVQNINNPDWGDQTIEECVLGGAAHYQVLYQSGGGLRFVNNKINGAYAVGLMIFLAPGIVTGDLICMGNSIEGADYGILVQRQAPSANFNNIGINANQITARNQCIGFVDDGGPTPINTDFINISGNRLTPTSNGAVGCVMGRTSGAFIDGNVFLGDAGRHAIVWGSAAGAKEGTNHRVGGIV